LTLQLAGSWSTLRALDAESELDAWKFDGLRVLMGLLALYLLAAAFVSFLGFFGVLRVRRLVFATVAGRVFRRSHDAGGASLDDVAVE
jgi:hypothetical protein